jgi:hypothetical protein
VRHEENVRRLEQELGEIRSQAPEYVPEGWEQLGERVAEAHKAATTPRNPIDAVGELYRRDAERERQRRDEDGRERRIAYAVQQVKLHLDGHASGFERQRSLETWLGRLLPDERAEAERRLRDLLPTRESGEPAAQLGQVPTLRGVRALPPRLDDRWLRRRRR